eukprot:g5855.t1
MKIHTNMMKGAGRKSSENREGVSLYPNMFGADAVLGLNTTKLTRYVLAVAVVAFGLVLYFVGFLSWRWKVDDDRPKNKKQHPAVALFLNVFDPDGKYYLVKTYLSELLEYAVQLYALDVYNCNFPVAVTSTFYALLAVEAVVLALARPTTVRRRNTRVLEDVVLDVQEWP